MIKPSPSSTNIHFSVETTPGVFYELHSDETFAVRGRKKNLDDFQERLNVFSHKMSMFTSVLLKLIFFVHYNKRKYSFCG